MISSTSRSWDNFSFRFSVDLAGILRSLRVLIVNPKCIAKQFADAEISHSRRFCSNGLILNDDYILTEEEFRAKLKQGIQEYRFLSHRHSPDCAPRSLQSGICQNSESDKLRHLVVGGMETWEGRWQLSMSRLQNATVHDWTIARRLPIYSSTIKVPDDGTERQALIR